jgi:hypothetical protein
MCDYKANRCDCEYLYSILVIDRPRGMFPIKTCLSPVTVMTPVLQIHSLIYYRRYTISAIYSIFKRTHCEQCTRSYHVSVIFYLGLCVCVCEIWSSSKFWRHHSHPNERRNRKKQNCIMKRLVICASHWLLRSKYKFLVSSNAEVPWEP